MIELEQIVGFEWDAGNARKSEIKHGVTQAEAEQAFFLDPLIIVADPKHGLPEERFHALGQTLEGRRLLVSFTLRKKGTLLRVISARDMNRKERMRYDQKT